MTTAKKGKAATKAPKKSTAKTKAKTAVKAPAKPAAKKTAVKSPAKTATKKPAAKAKSAPLTGAMLAVKKMADAVTKALDMNKAEDIITIDLTRKSSLADFMIVASGRSGRQVGALARFAEKALYDTGAKRCRVEGLPQGDWVVVDSGDVVVHVFRPEVREFYQLEKLWSDDAAEHAKATRRSLA